MADPICWMIYVYNNINNNQSSGTLTHPHTNSYASMVAHSFIRRTLGSCNWEILCKCVGVGVYVCFVFYNNLVASWLDQTWPTNLDHTLTLACWATTTTTMMMLTRVDSLSECCGQINWPQQHSSNIAANVTNMAFPRDPLDCQSRKRLWVVAMVVVFT